MTLGGDNGLRGFPTQAFIAGDADRLRGNVEWRSSAWVLGHFHTGLVTFYDFGSVYTEPAAFELRQSAGLGVRALLPQVNRSVLRLDAGVPLGVGGFTVLLSVESGQALPITVREAQLFDNQVGGLTNQP